MIMRTKTCALGVLGSAILVAGGAQAQTVTDEELARLVRAQAAEIAALKTRLTALEGSDARGPDGVIRLADAEEEEEEEGGLEVEWGEGAPELSSADGKYSFRLRGRVLVDGSTTTGSDFDARNITTTGARAVRIGIEGGIGEHFIYQMETDIAEGEPELKGAYIGWRSELAGHAYDVRVGSILSNRTLEASTGNDNTPFIERNVVATALNPQRGFFGLGAMTRVYGPNYHASLHLVGDDTLGGTAGQTKRDTFSVIGRAHWNPIKSDSHALHLGVWGYTESLTSDLPTFARNTDIGGRWNDNLTVSLGTILGLDKTSARGLEVGGFNRSLWAFAEAGERDLSIREALGGGEVSTQAWSISAGWFLTGENAPYSARAGNWSVPEVRNGIEDGGWGALELLARYENLDYSDAPLGGEGRAFTLGANWYFTDITRVMLNFIAWETENRAGGFIGPDEGQTITARAQVSF